MHRSRPFQKRDAKITQLRDVERDLRDEKQRLNALNFQLRIALAACLKQLGKATSNAATDAEIVAAGLPYEVILDAVVVPEAVVDKTLSGDMWKEFGPVLAHLIYQPPVSGLSGAGGFFVPEFMTKAWQSIGAKRRKLKFGPRKFRREVSLNSRRQGADARIRAPVNRRRRRRPRPSRSRRRPHPMKLRGAPRCRRGRARRGQPERRSARALGSPTGREGPLLPRTKSKRHQRAPQAWEWPC